MRLARKIFRFILLAFLIGVSAFITYYLIATKDAHLQPSKLLLSERTVIVYDCAGEQVKSALPPSFKEQIPLKDIPKHTQAAFIDTEDKRFFTHGGFDLRRMARAALNNLKARSFKEGASTISQQLIKNTHLSQEKTIKRKLKEFKLTRKLEKQYSKEEILEKYLNSIYFGHNCFGIGAAAEFYFNKSPAELTLADSAILAGLVKSPNNYSPFKNPEQCARRKQTVLSAMLKNGSITPIQQQEALHTPLPLSKAQSKHYTGYLAFVFDELGAIAEEMDLQLGGRIEISTGLTPSIQAQAEEIFSSVKECDYTALVLDGETGLFKAAVSTVGNIKRLPGSLIKPLLVYAPALQENLISPATPILDEKVNFGGYAPENYDGKFYGYTSARVCVEKSLNIPAVKLLQSLGIQKGMDYLEKLNLKTEDCDASLALALGGMKNGYTLRDMTSAYSAFQTGGVYQGGAFITKIKIDGATVYEKPTAKARVFDEDTAYLMTDMLKGAAKTGTAKKLRALPFEIAAKTGTVGTKNGNTDAYALSYTSRDCVSVWLGNADNTAIEHTGGGLPCNLLLALNEALQKAQGDIPNFQTPKTIARVALDKKSYYDTHTLALADELSPMEYRFEEVFKTTQIPTKKADFFTNPRILPPILRLTDEGVMIELDKTSPSFYSYKIVRTDYATHTTVYEGDFIPAFIDKKIEKDKIYCYTITPIYQGREGTSITLPSVNTKAGLSKNERDMLDKEWWEY